MRWTAAEAQKAVARVSRVEKRFNSMIKARVEWARPPQESIRRRSGLSAGVVRMAAMAVATVGLSISPQRSHVDPKVRQLLGELAGGSGEVGGGSFDVAE